MLKLMESKGAMGRSQATSGWMPLPAIAQEGHHLKGTDQRQRHRVFRERRTGHAETERKVGLATLVRRLLPGYLVKCREPNTHHLY